MGKKVAIVGSGNWGSTIAKIVGNNVVNIPAFDKQVNMWVFEELINGEKLSEVINTRHENIKYLPGVNLPTGVVAVTDVVETCKDADILVFVLPHQFLRRVCDSLKGKLKPNCYSISLIKGLDVADKGLHLISDVIKTSLGIPCHVLMGANLANEVAQEMFCEATIGAVNQDQGQELKSLMQTDYFRLVVSSDATCVELCGALKNIVALGAGFAEGMGYGENTKAAVIRLGLMEMKKFIRTMYAKDGIQEGTFFESCGIADLITTCYGGRNLKVSKAFVKSGKSMAELEKELLNGQSAQGILTAKEVYEVLTHTNQKAEYPMFVAIHQVCEGEVKPQDFINMLRSHPEHM